MLTVCVRQPQPSPPPQNSYMTSTGSMQHTHIRTTNGTLPNRKTPHSVNHKAQKALPHTWSTCIYVMLFVHNLFYVLRVMWIISWIHYNSHTYSPFTFSSLRYIASSLSTHTCHPQFCVSVESSDAWHSKYNVEKYMCSILSVKVQERDNVMYVCLRVCVGGNVMSWMMMMMIIVTVAFPCLVLRRCWQSSIPIMYSIIMYLYNRVLIYFKRFRTMLVQSGRCNSYLNYSVQGQLLFITIIFQHVFCKNYTVRI